MCSEKTSDLERNVQYFYIFYLKCIADERDNNNMLILKRRTLHYCSKIIFVFKYCDIMQLIYYYYFTGCRCSRKTFQFSEIK